MFVPTFYCISLALTFHHFLYYFCYWWLLIFVFTSIITLMARNSLLCADVPLRNYSLTHSRHSCHVKACMWFVVLTGTPWTASVRPSSDSIEGSTAVEARWQLYCKWDEATWRVSNKLHKIRSWTKARFPLPELTASGNARPSTRPVLTGNGNRSPVNSGRQLG